MSWHIFIFFLKKKDLIEVSAKSGDHFNDVKVIFGNMLNEIDTSSLEQKINLND